MVAHEIAVQAFGSRAEGAPLTIVERSDEDFVAGLIADLATEAGRDGLARRGPARGAGGTLELFQPVHRAFNLALLELFCREPGLPRLDPRRVESSGLVVRRVWTPDAPPGARPVEAWMKTPDGRKGWTHLATEADRERDPDPKRRAKPSTGNAEIDRRLYALLPAPDAEEHVTALFVAPPAVCAAAGRTLLFGLVPTASADTSVSPPATYRPEDLDGVVPELLRAGSHTLPSDVRGRTLTRYDADRLEGRPFMTMLALLTVALGLFPRDGSDPASTRALALRAQLDRLSVGGRPGGRFLSDAARALVWRVEGAGVAVPDAWPAVPADVALAVRAAMAGAFEAQAGAIIPAEGRFEVARAEYVARAFVRVRRDDGCPPRLLWGAPSEPFRIRPWHANGPLPPLRVTLPDLVPDRLEGLKPNVAFVVPKGLAAFMNNNTAKALLKGAGTPGSATLGWICGFNIPIITICAFIVLSIFLSLLHIVFWWLPFVKICIPFPSSLAKRLEERP
jgi:hypothetical protein